MNKIALLKAAVTKRSNDEEAYWNSLYPVYEGFQRGFSNYLGLKEDELIKTQNGRLCRVITAGLFDDESGMVVRKPYWQLPLDGLALKFDIEILLGDENSDVVRISLRFEVLLSKASLQKEEYVLESPNFGIRIVCHRLNENVNLTPFFDEVHLKILEKLELPLL